MQEPAIHSMRSRFSEAWGSLPIRRKLIIGLAVAASIAGIVSLALWSSRPDYVVLFTGLSPEDTQSIEDELHTARVPFKRSGDGASIMVPSSEVYRMRLRLADKGLPEVGAVGFEGFDKTDFGMTDFVQQLKYQRALQVELARTITQIREVMAARVHIVLPRQTVFIEREQPAKASVVLKLRPGASMSRSQVSGIVHLVASATEGLQKENVTVLDTSGSILSAPSGTAFVDNSQLDYQQVVESELKSKVQNMLDKVLGPGKAAIQVAVELDFTATETTSEVYDPETTVVKSETSTEYKTKGMSEASGIPGVTPSVQPASPVLPEYNRSESTTEYEVSKTVKHTTQQPGKITKLSVAVVVDNKKVNDESIPWTQQELKDIEGLVRNAVGVDASRGDPQIEIRNIPFDTSLQQETAAMEKTIEREQLRDTIMKAGIAVAIVLFLFLALRSLLKRRPARETLSLPEGVQGGPSLQEAEEGAAIPGRETAAGALGAPIPSPSDKILALLEKEPDTLARLIRQWMSEK
jgi:flagellar M-ring protein FliF